jgi:Fe-Mn family superoxide dismutase
LINQQIFEKNGVPDCLSSEGFDMAWTQYQGYLVHKLNLLTAGALRF